MLLALVVFKGLAMLSVVPAGILTVRHFEERSAAAKAGPSSPPELDNVHAVVCELLCETTASTNDAEMIAPSM